MSDDLKVSFIIIICMCIYAGVAVLYTYKPHFVRIQNNGRKYLGIEYFDLGGNLIYHKILRYL